MIVGWCVGNRDLVASPYGQPDTVVNRDPSD